MGGRTHPNTGPTCARRGRAADNRSLAEPLLPVAIPSRIKQPTAAEMSPLAPAPAPAPAPAQGRRRSVVEILEMTEDLDPELREQQLRRFLQE